jgi:hypothetical protein
MKLNSNYWLSLGKVIKCLASMIFMILYTEIELIMHLNALQIIADLYNLKSNYPIKGNFYAIFILTII